MQLGGIYEILNTVNGKRYIGSAVDFGKREKQHFRGLAGRRHHNSKLQNSWDKHGPAAFEFRPVMICAPTDLILWEQRYIDEFKPEYNLSPTAGSPLGMKHTLESRANMSAGHNGVGQTPDVLAKMSDTLRGHPMPLEQRKKISDAHIANHAAKPPKAKKVVLPRKGRILSAAHRAAIGDANRGKKRGPQPPEQTAKIAKANRGAKRTAEQCQNISQGARRAFQMRSALRAI